VRLVAHHVGTEVHAERLGFSAGCPRRGAVRGSAAAGRHGAGLRKAAVTVFTLHDYVAAGTSAPPRCRRRWIGIGLNQFVGRRVDRLICHDCFQLVLWTPSLEKLLDRHVSGVTRGDGGMDWGFGRNRGLGL